MSFLVDYLVKPVGLATAISAISYVLFALPGLFRRQGVGKASFVNTTDLLLGWAFTVVIFVVFLGLLRQLDAQAKSLQIILVALAMALLPVYGWVLQPATYFWRQRRFTALPEWEAFLQQQTGHSIRVLAINQDFYNALATGALPFSRVILIGRPLLNQLTREEVEAVLLHEAGHVIHRDLPRLCALSVLLGAVSAVVFCALQVLMARWQVGGYWVAIYGTVQYVISYGLITGPITRQMEYRADQFAAEHVGPAACSSMLQHLDTLTKGMLQRGNVTHPVLAKRLAHIARTAGLQAS